MQGGRHRFRLTHQVEPGQQVFERRANMRFHSGHDTTRTAESVRSIAVRETAPMAPEQQSVVTLDLEGVLVPEIWIAVAERTGIEALRRTTRDEPDYDKLMAYRIALLDEHDLTMSQIDHVIAGLSPLPRARTFLDKLRSMTQVILLSDTFEQFGRPFMAQLGWPTLLCHRLVVQDDRIVDYQLRMPDQKRHAVQALRALNYRVVAAGDSYNDTAMLAAAHTGFLFHAPENVKAQFPQFTALDDYEDLLAAIRVAIEAPTS
jgi:phosphoserine/homoserine phosphotransferase